MTGTKDKIRSLFLTALMVMSVFAGSVAFAGTAAAANLDDTTYRYSIGSDADTAGNSDALEAENTDVQHSTEANIETSDDISKIEIVLEDADVDGVSASQIDIVGSPGIPTGTVGSTDGLSLDRSSGDTIVISVADTLFSKLTEPGVLVPLAGQKRVCMKTALPSARG